VAQYDKEASQTRDYRVAKNATLRAARPDSSRRKERLFGMTIVVPAPDSCRAQQSGICDSRGVMSKDPPARRFLVRGRVQGVGFRWFVEREAHILGIAGWVRNNADSSVEVLAMGTRDQLAGLRSRLREGPRAARVDDVEESEAKPVADLTSFRIEGAW
jgi:acylphosphatase